MRWLACGLLLVIVIGVCAPAVAEPSTVPLPHGQPIELDPEISTQITKIRTGSNAEQFGIVTVDPISNPAHCAIADGYMSDSTQPGYHTYYAAALLAFAERATVIVVVARFGCVADHPKLIGINIVR
jgi:hypothetical protein